MGNFSKNCLIFWEIYRTFSSAKSLSDTLRSTKGNKSEMEIYKQQIEFVKRHLHTISIYGRLYA